MKRLFQTIHTDLSKGIKGNCLQTCIACITEIPIEEIPRYYTFKDYYPFFFDRGFSTRLVIGKPPVDNALYIARYSVVGVKDIGHVVIYRNGRIIHDPKNPRARLSRIRGYFEIRQWCQMTPNLPINRKYDNGRRENKRSNHSTACRIS